MPRDARCSQGSGRRADLAGRARPSHWQPRWCDISGQARRGAVALTHICVMKPAMISSVRPVLFTSACEVGAREGIRQVLAHHDLSCRWRQKRDDRGRGSVLGDSGRPEGAYWTIWNTRDAGVARQRQQLGGFHDGGIDAVQRQAALVYSNWASMMTRADLSSALGCSGAPAIWRRVLGEVMNVFRLCGFFLDSFSDPCRSAEPRLCGADNLRHLS